MVLDRNRNLLFIHIPKTGGGTIEKMLNIPLTVGNFYSLKSHKGNTLQHYTLSQFEKEIGQDLIDKCYKFSFVRNPYDKIISAYFWCKIPKLGYRHKDTFTGFLKKIQNIVENNIKGDFRYCHFIEQHKFIYDENDKLKVDFLGRFENFDEDLQTLCKNIDISYSSQIHANKNNLKKEKLAKNLLTPENIEIINKIYAKDFELLEYEKILF